MTPDSKLEEQETRQQVRAALHALPEMERQVATLLYISEYSRQDISDFLQVPLATELLAEPLRAGPLRRISQRRWG